MKLFRYAHISSLLLLIILVISTGLAVLTGAYQLSFESVISVLFEQGDVTGTEHFLIWQIRIPRVILAGLTGAGLAITGASIQGLFRNPLADPGLIGINSGAMLFAALSIVLLGQLFSDIPVFMIQLSTSFSAFTGGLLTTLLVYAISRQGKKTMVITMLLAGIAISAFTAAITGVMIYISDEQQLRDITFWTLGSFNSANWSQLMIVSPVVFVGIMILNRFSRPLNAILLGEQEASYLGIEVEYVKRWIILLTALIVGVCIAFSGIIGFVGLIVPHFLRLMLGSDYRQLLINSALLGAAFMIVSDLIARTFIAPAELPVGIITALIGAPFFVWLLLKTRSELLSIK